MLSALRSIGQNSYVRGTVLDKSDGIALIGAHVIPMSDWDKGVVTDVNGRFELMLDQSDSILVSFVGYEERMFFVTPGLDYELKLETKGTSLTTLEIVSERLISEEFSVKKIDRLDVYKNPSAKADPLLAVNALPSVTTVDESANVSFRGSGPGETGVFFNQVPIYDAVRFSQINGIGTFSIFNTELINQIHVFPGNPPLEYGNTSSGLIAIDTKNQVSHNSAQLSVSMANLGFSTALNILKKTQVIAYGNYQPSGLLTLANSRLATVVPWFQSFDGGLQLSHQFSDKSQLKVFNYTLSEGYDFNFTSPTYVGTFEQRKNRNFTVANYRYQHQFGVTSVNAGYNTSQTDLEYSRFSHQIRNTDVYFSVNHHRERHRLEWKGGLAFDHRLRGFHGLVPIYDFALSTDHPALSVQSNENRTIVDGFLYAKYRPSDKISFGYAIRSNAPWISEDVKMGRQSSIFFVPFSAHQFVFSSGTYHRYDWLDNQSLAWTSSKQIALDYQFDHQFFQFGLSGYVKNAHMDANQQEIAGVEVQMQVQPNSKWFWDLSYSYIDVTNQIDDRKAPGRYDMDYFIRSGVSWSFMPLWTVGGRFLWRQGVYTDEVIQVVFRDDLQVYEPTMLFAGGHDSRLPFYQVFDMNLSRLFQLADKFSGVFFLSASNIFDRNNVRDYTYSDDYQERNELNFGRRIFYTGVVFNFQ
jgi:hypothetical protein